MRLGGPLDPGHGAEPPTPLIQLLRFTLAAGLVAGLHADTEETPAAPAGIQWKQEREFWAFRPPVAHPRPAVGSTSWSREPLDPFILARLEANGLKPSPEAARRTLIRRVSFDLSGLPPTPHDIAQFLADSAPGAWERVVDRLLASPAFGERMASVWLPLVRYGEDQAHQVGDDSTYFYPNAWRYRAWVIHAFNADLPYDRFLVYQLAADRVSSATDADQAALGMLGLGPKYYDRGRLAVQAEEWEDRVDTVCRTILGLTVACARCHDHKFEPITSADYYALAGVFASTRMVNQRPDGFVEKANTPSQRMQPDTMHVVSEDKPKDLNVFLRGNVDRKGALAERRFLQILSGDTPEKFVDGSGRRELAMALASRDNPLTARVLVNRLWAEFFGRPLVATPSNFGHSGSLPTHPELLDDLAVRFMQHGWSMKSLVREFVLSATYRQQSPTASAAESSAGGVDPDNLWLSRMPRKRLSVEQWRDAMLFVTGELEPEPAAGRSGELSDPANHRRTVYARISRLKLDDTLMQFDYPDANVHAEKRGQTTTALQKLFVLNSPFVLERARVLSARSAREVGAGADARVGWLYRQLYGREASEMELALARRFLATVTAEPERGWERYAQTLLAANEFVFVD